MNLQASCDRRDSARYCSECDHFRSVEFGPYVSELCNLRLCRDTPIYHFHERQNANEKNRCNDCFDWKPRRPFWQRWFGVQAVKEAKP
jgi:hypothetical protein